MELSEGQELLIGYLKSIGMKEELIVATMLAVQEQNQTEKLIDYILDNKEIITADKILHKALQISQE